MGEGGSKAPQLMGWRCGGRRKQRSSAVDGLVQTRDIDLR